MYNKFYRIVFLFKVLKVISRPTMDGPLAFFGNLFFIMILMQEVVVLKRCKFCSPGWSLALWREKKRNFRF